MVVSQQTADLRRSTVTVEIDQSSLAEQAGIEVGIDIPRGAEWCVQVEI